MNLFPALITIDGAAHRTCRVIAQPEGTVIYEWPNGRRSPDHPETLLAVSAQPVEEVRDRRWTLETDDGDTVVIARQNGCGCGHPGKRWRPPGTIRAGT